MATNLQALQDGSAPAKKERTLLNLLADPKVKESFAKVIGNAMTPERMVQLCITAAKGNEKLRKCTPMSVLGCMMTAAALGLEPNTPLGQAYLIPYGKRAKNTQGKWEVASYECQFQIGYRGYVTLAHRSPHIAEIQAECIHENDTFDYQQGSKTFLTFKKTLKNRGLPIGSFCFVRFTSGAEAALVLPLDEIEKIRECSDTYTSLRDNVGKETEGWKKKSAQEKFDSTPWVMWFDDMAIKSAIKKFAKQLPIEQAPALHAAASLDGGEGQIIDMETMADPDSAMSVVSGESYADHVEQTESLEYMPAETLPIDIQQRDAVPVEQQRQHEPAQRHESSRQESQLPELMRKMFSAKTAQEVNAIVSDGMAVLVESEAETLRNRGVSKIDELSRGGQMSLE